MSSEAPLEEKRAVVWLVDDSPTQAEIVRRGLVGRHEVIVFERAAPMLVRLAMGERPDLLVVDWVMPELSGVEACRFVRESTDGATLPIIVLTATGGHQELIEALEAGANDFLRKPFDEAELNARVAVLVRSRRLHQRLTLAEAALRAEASFREQFLAILAHDLRQPLNVFALAGGVLASASTPQAMRESVSARLVSASKRMQRMIAELLDFSRVRPAGGMPLAPRPVNLAVIVDEVIAEIRLAHPTRTIDVTASEPCKGTWDADRLAQVVSNLVENALAHSAADSPVTLTLSTTDRRIELAVENVGPTIAPEILPTLFDAFRRGPSTVRAAQGLGLGLYIVAQIAKGHGGDVSAHSQGGRTIFRMWLPREAA